MITYWYIRSIKLGGIKGEEKRRGRGGGEVRWGKKKLPKSHAKFIIAAL